MYNKYIIADTIGATPVITVGIIVGMVGMIVCIICIKGHMI